MISLGGIPAFARQATVDFSFSDSFRCAGQTAGSWLGSWLYEANRLSGRWLKTQIVLPSDSLVIMKNGHFVPRIEVLRWRLLESLGGRHDLSHAYVTIYLPFLAREDLSVVNAYPQGAAHGLIAWNRASRYP